MAVIKESEDGVVASKYANSNHAKTFDEVKDSKVIYYKCTKPYGYTIFHFSNGKWMLIVGAGGNGKPLIWDGNFTILREGTEIWELAKAMYVLPGQKLPISGGDNA